MSSSTQVGIATGAARGMGLACARRMVGTVDVLFVVDRDGDGAKQAADTLSTSATRAVPVTLDVTDRDGVRAFGDKIATEGTLRAVAHAAGISPTMADWQAVVRVDLVGTALLVDALTPLVVPGTAMVCFASMAAQLAADSLEPALDAVLDAPLDEDLLERLRRVAGEMIEDSGAAYGVAKRGVQRLVQRTAVEWGGRGGRINSVSPGMIDTPMGRQEFENQPMMKVMLEMTPLAREGTADELADAVTYLLSDAASFVTGTDLLVDGGVVAALRSAASRTG
jgi:NAD(P)-dependent dehydrogenase (short-subunit alcohol dehydrogenase family)